MSATILQFPGPSERRARARVAAPPGDVSWEIRVQLVALEGAIAVLDTTIAGSGICTAEQREELGRLHREFGDLRRYGLMLPRRRSPGRC